MIRFTGHSMENSDAGKTVVSYETEREQCELTQRAPPAHRSGLQGLGLGSGSKVEGVLLRV